MFPLELSFIPVASDEIATVGSSDAGERVLKAARRALVVYVVEPFLPPNIAARVERRDEHTIGIGIVLTDDIVLSDRHIAAIGGLLHRVEIRAGPGRYDRS
jgi:hypothetical protein